MSMQPLSDPSETPAEMPFPAPCRTLQTSAPLRWLRLGWADMKRAPRLSLTYGFVLMLISALIGLLTWRYGTFALYFGLATGFVFVGPILAVGLYSISRQLEAGLKPFMGYCIQEGWHHVRGLMVLGLVLLIVLLVWARAAAMVHIFVPVDANPTWQELVPFIGIGSVVGGLNHGRGEQRECRFSQQGRHVGMDQLDRVDGHRWFCQRISQLYRHAALDWTRHLAWLPRNHRRIGLAQKCAGRSGVIFSRSSVHP
jgi:hypothetical protein